jgi:hypothetical protein
LFYSPKEIAMKLSTAIVYLPKRWNRERVEKKEEIRRKQYVIEGFKTRGGQQELSRYIVQFDEEYVDARARQMASFGFTHAVTLSSEPSVDIMSLHYKVRLYIDRCNRKKKKLPDKEVALRFKGTTPYYSIFEFGDKLGGLHTHLLMASPLSTADLETEWAAINGESQAKLALVNDLSTVEDRIQMVRYYTLMEEVYSQVVEKNNTEHMHYLITHGYEKLISEPEWKSFRYARRNR